MNIKDKLNMRFSDEKFGINMLWKIIETTEEISEDMLLKEEKQIVSNAKSLLMKYFMNYGIEVPCPEIGQTVMVLADGHSWCRILFQDGTAYFDSHHNDLTSLNRIDLKEISGARGKMLKPWKPKNKKAAEQLLELVKQEGQDKTKLEVQKEEEGKAKKSKKKQVKKTQAMHKNAYSGFEAAYICGIGKKFSEGDVSYFTKISKIKEVEDKAWDYRYNGAFTISEQLRKIIKNMKNEISSMDYGKQYKNSFIIRDGNKKEFEALIRKLYQKRKSCRYYGHDKITQYEVIKDLVYSFRYTDYLGYTEKEAEQCPEIKIIAQKAKDLMIMFNWDNVQNYIKTGNKENLSSEVIDTLKEANFFNDNDLKWKEEIEDAEIVA